MDRLVSNAIDTYGMDTDAWMLKMDPVSFGKRFREAREIAGLTQSEIANICGISNRTVSAWEKGRAKGMLAQHLFTASAALRVDPKWLATGEVTPNTALAEIVRDLERLPAEHQEAVRALVQSLAK